MRRWVMLDVAEPTKTDMETLCLLFRGATYDEIAAKRHRSKKTVEKTIRRLLNETDKRNSRELLYHALSRGWLTPPQLAKSGTVDHAK